MRRFLVLSLVLSAGWVLPTGCERRSQSTESESTRQVREVVLEFGRRLQRVSLLAPQAAQEMRREYGDLVSPDLLAKWTRDLQSAPGRLVSSPWPDRIEIERVAPTSAGKFLVTGEIVERTSTDRPGRETIRLPVRLTVSKVGDKWRISEFDRQAPPAAAPDPSPAGAAEVIRAYYEAINAGGYRDAYRLWESNGEASRKTFEQFRDGFSNTASVALDVGTPGPIGAAAGSRYVEIPVRIVATMRDGGREAYEGQYTLRRSEVDGATPEQRIWRIYSASLKRVQAR